MLMSELNFNDWSVVTNQSIRNGEGVELWIDESEPVGQVRLFVDASYKR